MVRDPSSNAALQQRQLKQVVAGGGAESDERVRRNIQVALAKKLQEKSSRFRSLQKEYMSKLKSQRTGSSGGSELEFLSRPGQQRGVSTQQISVGFTQQQLEVRATGRRGGMRQIHTAATAPWVMQSNLEEIIDFRHTRPREQYFLLSCLHLESSRLATDRPGGGHRKK